MDWPHGFLLVDKPAGDSSRRVVTRVQKALGPPPGRRGRGAPRFRCGHAGTLDPLATGLLVVLVGAGTRLSAFLQGCDKVYRATVRFGTATDTLDADGEVVLTAPVAPDASALDRALAARVGPADQVPPLVSAIKLDGRPLHRRVRAGEDLAPPPPRRVTLHDLRREGELRTVDDGLWDADVRVGCSSGTYVRSLARDLGEDLGGAAHIHALRRLEAGSFRVDDALPAALLDDPAAVRAALRPLAAALPDIPALAVSVAEAAELRQGRQPEADWLTRLPAPPRAVAAGREPLWRMLDADGGLVALGRLETGADAAAAPRVAAVFPPSMRQEVPPCT